MHGSGEITNWHPHGDDIQRYFIPFDTIFPIITARAQACVLDGLFFKTIAPHYSLHTPITFNGLNYNVLCAR